MRKQVAYLGDGAYARTGSYAGEVILYTSNGLKDTNTVVLGPAELIALLAFLQTVQAVPRG